MELELYRDVVASLPKGRTLFLYERDRFAVSLLRYLVDAGWSARQLRASPFARLLERRPVRDILAAVGSLELTGRDLALAAMPTPVPWRLTVGRWAAEKQHRFRQASRAGSNIVLHLNLPGEHARQVKDLVSPRGDPLFTVHSHPMSAGEHTFAWARIDVDFDAGEALIEEIQSDWPRVARSAAARPSWFHARCTGDDVSVYPLPRFQTGLRRYLMDVLPRYEANWQETMMAASLFFIVEELGLRSVYLHEFESGNTLKNIRWAKPPRSLYTDLPRKFCFQARSDGPSFLSREARRVVRRHETPLAFWRLGLDKGGMS